jgi:glucose-1-phosphate adenylyltransferase
MLGTHRVFAHDFFDDRGLPAYWRDVGTLTAYYEAQMDLVDQPATFRLSMPASLPHPRLSGLVSDPAARTLRDAGSVVAGSATCSVFSPRVVVEPGASVERAVILDGAVIESGAIVRDAVIGPFARVLCGAVVGGGPWAAAVCPPGRVYRTLGGVAVVPAHEVIGPERLGSRLAQAMPGFYTRTSQWEARSMAATCQPPRTASSAASSGMTTRSTG